MTKPAPDAGVLEAGTGNQFRAGAKFDEVTLIRLAYCFCQGLPLTAGARSTGLTVKTVREVTVGLRRRLFLKSAFNRWHRYNTTLVQMEVELFELLLRESLFDRVARCAGDAYCARNYRLGNRKNRQCRACPLAGFLSEPRLADAYRLIDTIHSFYEALGIRTESAIPPALLFRYRLTHVATLSTVRQSSRILANGLFDPAERTFLSGGTLLDTLLTDLASEPLDVNRLSSAAKTLASRQDPERLEKLVY